MENNNNTSKSGWSDFCLYLILAVLSIIMIFDAVMKLTTNAHHVAQFEAFGYSMAFLFITGLLEVLAAVLIWLPKTRFQANILILIIMAVAAFSNFSVGATAEILLNFAIAIISLYAAYRSKAGCCLLKKLAAARSGR